MSVTRPSVQQSTVTVDDVGLCMPVTKFSNTRRTNVTTANSSADVVTIGGIPTVRATRSQLASLMVSDCRLRSAGKPNTARVVVSSNGAVIAAFHRDVEFRRSILQADIVDADGMSLVLATKLLCRVPLRERVATTDFIHDACAAAVKHELRFFFLGGADGIAAQAASNLRTLYPGLQIVGTHKGYFRSDEEAGLCEEIERVGTDVLWVGLGSPLQERFAATNRDRLTKVAWIRTCGGLFDHYVDGAKRAPDWMQDVGLEWLHRVIREPIRLGPRYLMTNPIAAFHLATKTYD